MTNADAFMQAVQASIEAQEAEELPHIVVVHDVEAGGTFYYGPYSKPQQASIVADQLLAELRADGDIQSSVTVAPIQPPREDP